MATAFVAAALVTLLPLAQAMQPGAVPARPAPMRSLQWGEINFLHTTDTHGWHAGHLQESQYSADWGDYVSFAEHMRKRADDDGVDLLLVDTGDRVEGNGLYDASTPKGLYTSDIVREQTIDLLCSGNHELYQAATIEREHGLTVPRFRGAYLASNLDYVDPATGAQRAMAPQRYLAFQTKNRHINVVAFGFLFNFTGNAANAAVQPVQQTVRTAWFQRAIRDEPADLFVVIGHVAARMDELRVVYAAIRAANPDTPIALLAGHAHVRDTVRFDARALAVASGRYFETIGWLSVSGVTPADGDTNPPKPSFQRRYIDNNLLGLYHHSGRNASTFPTDHGRNVTAAIATARAELQLDARLGCAPQNYWLHRRPHTSRDSVFGGLLRSRVLPEALVRPDRAAVPRLVVVNTGALRFDVFRGAFTQDTQYIVSPFVSRIHFLRDVPYALARHVLPLLNNQGPILSAMAAEKATTSSADNTAGAATAAAARSASRGTTDWRQLAGPEQYAGSNRRQQVDAASGHPGEQKPLMGGRPGPSRPEQYDDDNDDDKVEDEEFAAWPPLVAGYTTWDDLGFGGDDAIHEPIPYFQLPNCIQAEVAFPAASSESSPDTVDLVFFDFIEKLVVQALNYAAEAEYGGGGDDENDDPSIKHYTDADIETYIEGTFTDHLADWVKHNWGDEDC